MFEPIDYAPGVTYTPCIWWDSYTGTDADVMRAGLVRPDQMPGAPGNGRTMVTFLPDGQRVQKGSTRTRELAGCLSARRRGKHRIEITMTVGREVSRQRRDEWDQQYEAEQALRRAWPFPVCHGRPV